MTSALGHLTIAPMTQTEAEAVAGWRYEAPYDFYDAPADEDDLALLLDPERRRDRIFSACAEHALVGFFEFRSAGDAVLVGLGLRPDLTGRGLGASFIAAGLDFARELFEPRRFRLRVATFNERAIKVYERAGFVRTRSFAHETNSSVHPFIEMERPA